MGPRLINFLRYLLLPIIHFLYGFLRFLFAFVLFYYLLLVLTYIPSVCNFLHLVLLVVSFVAIFFFLLVFCQFTK